MNDAEAKPLTDEELERVIRELYFDNVERKVKQNGNVKFEGKWYHVSKELSGETVEMNVTLRGVEAWHNGAFVKRWNYWEYVLDIAADSMLKKYLLSYRAWQKTTENFLSNHDKKVFIVLFFAWIKKRGDRRGIAVR